MRSHPTKKKSLWAKFRSLWSLPEQQDYEAQFRARPQVEMLENRQLLTVFTVNNVTDTIATGDGISLREAIRAASTNQPVGDAPAGDVGGEDTIVFDSTVFAQANDVTITLTDAVNFGDFEITDQLTINGTSGSGGGATSVTINGANLNRIFDIDSGVNGPVQISGVALINGNATDFGTSATDGLGGAIYITSGENVTLESVLISNNSASLRGGGIFNDGSTLTIDDSTLQNNTASGFAVNDGGGGLYSSGGLVSHYHRYVDQG